MNCLFCQNKIRNSFDFLNVFLLRNSQNQLCSICQKYFEKISDKHCQRCYKNDIDGICHDCQIWEEKGIFINHQAFFIYNQAMKDYFSRYKFLGDYRLRFAFSLFVKFDKKYTVVPIPVSQKRFEERGFNQVTSFLDAINCIYQELLVKSDSVKQSSLDRKARLESKNTFSIKENAVVPENILLIDDIYTTGATFQHAISVLKAAGAKNIKTFSLCR